MSAARNPSKAGATRTVTAAVRSAKATQLFNAVESRRASVSKADVALNRAFTALTAPDAAFTRGGVRAMYAALAHLKRSAARVRIASLRDVYGAVAFSIPNNRIAAQYEDLSALHAKTAMLMVAARASLAAEGDASFPEQTAVAVDDNAYVVDQPDPSPSHSPEDSLSTAGSKRASRFSAMAALATTGEPAVEASAEENLTAAAAHLTATLSKVKADVETDADKSLGEYALPGQSPGLTGGRNANVETDANNVTDVSTTARDPQTPLDTSATAVRQRRADFNDDLPAEPGSTQQNVDTGYAGDPNDPDRGNNPGDGDASKGGDLGGQKPVNTAGRRRADFNDDLAAKPGTTKQNVDTSYKGDPNDPDRGNNPGDGDASKDGDLGGEKPVNTAARGRANKVQADSRDGVDIDQMVSTAAGELMDPMAGPAPGMDPSAAPPPPAPPGGAPGGLPGHDDLGMGDDLDAGPGGHDFGDHGNDFDLQGQPGIDHMLSNEILGDGGFGDDGMDGPGMGAPGAPPAPEDDLSGMAPAPVHPAAAARAKASQRAAKLASATGTSGAAPTGAQGADAALRAMINHDLLG